jgi:hypothetical protein
MQLLYTGASTYNTAQKKKEYSLGGFISSTVVPNAQLGNLFSLVSKYAIENDSFEVIALALKNDSLDKYYSVNIWFELPTGNYCDFEIAVVTLSQDTNDYYYMETLINNQSLPYNATFYSCNGQANAIDIGDLDSSGMVGLFIKRKINTTNTALLNDNTTLNDNYNNGVVLSQKEDVALKFSWSLDQSISL